MANFSPAFLDELLARVDLAELIGKHVELKRSGSNLMGLCPFHNEKSPSFSVSPDKQLFYCFGCGKGGGAFQFLMDHDGYTFPEAVEYLAEKAGMEVPKDAKSSPQDTEKRNRAFDLLARAADAFAGSLSGEQGAAARGYLEGRKLPQSIVRDYKLGFAPAGYGYMERTFGRDDRTLAQLEAVGLLFKGERGYADRFRDRLMFPIRDRRGKIVGFGGRVIGEGEPKYLNSPETPFFHKSELLYGLAEHRDGIRKKKRLLVVEGYMDVLALAAHGIPYAVAPLGTAIGERQIVEILRLHDSPVFCFDGDRAGRQAAWRALERMLPLLKAEHSPRFLYLPEGEDPDSLLAKEGNAAFGERIRSEAKPVLETWLQGLRNLAGSGADGRARMAKKADQMLAAMQDEYLKQAWRQEAENATGIGLQHASPARGSIGRFSERVSGRQVRRPRNIKAEEFLAALVQRPSRLRTLPQGAEHFLLDEPDLNRIYTRAFALMASETDAEITRRLTLEFGDDERVARWANQEPVSEQMFEILATDMHISWLQRLQKDAKMGNRGLEERSQLISTIAALKQKAKELKEQLDQ